MARDATLKKPDWMAKAWLREQKKAAILERRDAFEAANVAAAGIPGCDPMLAAEILVVRRCAEREARHVAACEDALPSARAQCTRAAALVCATGDSAATRIAGRALARAARDGSQPESHFDDLLKGENGAKPTPGAITQALEWIAHREMAEQAAATVAELENTLAHSAAALALFRAKDVELTLRAERGES